MFSLVVLSLMLVTALTLLSSAVLGERAALSTGNSTRSFQSADSGVEQVLYQIYRENYTNLSGLATAAGASCSGGTIVSSSGWRVGFYEGVDGNVRMTSCSDTDWRSRVTKIKSEGTATGTTRAEEAPVYADPTSGQIGYWKMDEGSWSGASGEVKDSSGSGHDGTAISGATTSASGHFGRAGSFSGAQGYVDLGTWFEKQQFTLSMWLRPGSSQVQYADIIDNNHTSFRSWVFQQNSTTTNEYGFGTNDGVTSCGVSPIRLTADVWQHVVVVRASDSLKVYVDGVLVGAATDHCSLPIRYDGTQRLSVANWGSGGRVWNGLVDDLRIYDRALSAVEVVRLFRYEP